LNLPYYCENQHRVQGGDARTEFGEKEKTMARTPIHPGEILGDELEEIAGRPARRYSEIPKRSDLPAEPRPAA
jgi:hypothetical protein